MRSKKLGDYGESLDVKLDVEEHFPPFPLSLSPTERSKSSKSQCLFFPSSHFCRLFLRSNLASILCDAAAAPAAEAEILLSSLKKSKLMKRTGHHDLMKDTCRRINVFKLIKRKTFHSKTTATYRAQFQMKCDVSLIYYRN